MIEYARGEIHSGQHQGHEILEPLVIEHPDVFEFVAGLDVSDRLFDAPTPYVGPYPAPETFEAPAQRLGGQQHEGFLYESMNDQ